MEKVTLLLPEGSIQTSNGGLTGRDISSEEMKLLRDCRTIRSIMVTALQGYNDGTMKRADAQQLATIAKRALDSIKLEMCHSEGVRALSRLMLSSDTSKERGECDPTPESQQ